MAKERVRLEPDNNRGGKRIGAGRPLGSMSKQTKNFIGEALRRGELPHQLLCEWVRTGVMSQPQYKPKIQVVTVKKADKKNKIKAETITKVDWVVEKDKHGETLYHDVALFPSERALLAVQAAPYFAAKVTAAPTVADQEQADLPGDGASDAEVKAFYAKLEGMHEKAKKDGTLMHAGTLSKQ